MDNPVTIAAEKGDSEVFKETHQHDHAGTLNVPKCPQKSDSFFQIRKQFEEKSKVPSIPPRPQIQETQTQLSPSIEKSDFQKLYPLFKCYYTKRQFTAIETSFNLADRNNDGFLEPKELKQLLVDHQKPINLCDADYIVGLGDKNNDGKLCPQEFLELCMPVVETLREEQFKQGNLLSDHEFVNEVLQGVRNLVPLVDKKVKGTRSFFENIISRGNADDEREKGSSSKATIVNRKNSADKEFLNVIPK